MDARQRRIWLGTHCVTAAIGLVAGLMTWNAMVGVAVFTGPLLMLPFGWPPPSANQDQDHMLRNPDRPR